MCLWNTWDDTNYFRKNAWKPCEYSTVRRLNLKHTPLVNLENILLPPLHIKLELMKTFVKAKNHDSTAFMYLKEKFGHFKSKAKLKEGVFIGLEIQKLLLDDQFTKNLIMQNWMFGNYLIRLLTIFWANIKLKLW